MVCCLPGARVLDVSEWVQDILKREGKQTEVIVHIDTNDIETWLKDGQDWQLNIPEYRCFRRDRKRNKRAWEWGFALLIRHHITAVLREDRAEGPCSEALWMELRIRKGEITMLGVFYRPPNSPRDTEEQICNQILERCEKSRVVVVGDFNFPLIDGDSLRARGSDGEQFVRCVQEGFLRQYVDNPTREETILDLVLGNEPAQVIDVSVGEHFGLSDHNSIRFRVVVDKDKTGPR
eukprot:g35270.t1